MEHEPRYERNRTTITPEEQQVLASARVCVCGCGGIGGYVIEMLARAGVGTIVAVDGDAFEASNLNRQLLAREDNLGCSKAEAARERVGAVNSQVNVVVRNELIEDGNAGDILAGCDLVVDALDSYQTRLALEGWCAEREIPLIHGAIAGWYAQVTAIEPGSHAIERIYPQSTEAGAEKALGNPSFTPALAASIEVAEAVKVLLAKGTPLYGKLLVMDLLRNTQRIIELD